ncbi:MAG TPA: DUF692 family protein [Saprospiraceae bacterium]|nr:DUF692 family protein [Saprospiraceae bacterium]HMQ85515.1 DUF692 family protein [Saprospiraceae bacterium]
MSKTCSALACNLDADLLSAALPLFEAGQVEALEWSFDALFQIQTMPSWFTDLLEAYASEKRLVGHGIFFSLFSGKWLKEQQDWLFQLHKLSRQFHFDHITEHFGFMTGENFHQGAPLSVPFNATTLAIGQDRLKRIQQACECPVGLENLAFAYTLDEVKKHGEFLHALIEPVNGFLILDLHNVYCQMSNFELNLNDVLLLYPIHRVREIHISGGSWADSTVLADKKIRRDTHDDPVPSPVFDMLEQAIPLCPNLKYVVLEQLGTSLKTSASQAAFRSDFHAMDRIVQKTKSLQPKTPDYLFLPQSSYPVAEIPLESPLLYQQQKELSAILETATSYEQAAALLRQSNLAQTDWGIERWQPEMLETAWQIAQKWKLGFDVHPDK